VSRRQAGRLHLETPLGEHEVDVAFDQPIGFLVADLVAAAGLPGDPLEWVLVLIEENAVDPSRSPGQTPGRFGPGATGPLPRPATLRSAGVTPGDRLRLERRPGVDHRVLRLGPPQEPSPGGPAPSTDASSTSLSSRSLSSRSLSSTSREPPTTRPRREPLRMRPRPSPVGAPLPGGSEGPRAAGVGRAGPTRPSEGCLVAVVAARRRAGATTLTALLASRLEWLGGRSLAVELPQRQPGEPRLPACLAHGRPVPLLDEAVRRVAGRPLEPEPPEDWRPSAGPLEAGFARTTSRPTLRERVIAAPAGRSRAEAIDEEQLVGYLRAQLAAGVSVFLDAGNGTEGSAATRALAAADQIVLVDAGSAGRPRRSSVGEADDAFVSPLWASGWPPLVVVNRCRGARPRRREIWASAGEVEPGPSLAVARGPAERLARGTFTWAEPEPAWADTLDGLLGFLGLP